MSRSDFPSEEEDSYLTDDPDLTVFTDSDFVSKLRKNANYFLRDDPNEPDRLDDIWEREREDLGSLHRYTLSSSPKVLDIGTGTGGWAIAFANEYPSASVIGFDASVIQPELELQNLEWHLGNLEKDLNYESNQFDLIHVGHMDGCVEKWDEFLKNVYRMLKPGGYVELLDHSFTIEFAKERETRYLSTLIYDLQRAAENRGRPLNMAPYYSGELENAGFWNISLEKRLIDINHNLDLVQRSLNAYTKGLLAPNAFQSELNNMLVRACFAAEEFKQGDCLILYRVCAQKPL